MRTLSALFFAVSFLVALGPFPNLGNRGLVNVIENPLGCYELARYDGDREAVMREVMAVFEPTGLEGEAQPAGR